MLMVLQRWKKTFLNLIELEGCRSSSIEREFCGTSQYCEVLYKGNSTEARLFLAVGMQKVIIWKVKLRAHNTLCLSIVLASKSLQSSL